MKFGTEEIHRRTHAGRQITVVADHQVDQPAKVIAYELGAKRGASRHLLIVYLARRAVNRSVSYMRNRPITLDRSRLEVALLSTKAQNV